MDIEELLVLLRSQRERVLPFVGSGMTVAAGAPSVSALAEDLARRTGVSLSSSASLIEVSTAAEQMLGAAAVQQHLAEAITGWRLHATPALTALCGVSTGRVLTTDYDDGIERSAEWRGLTPVPLLPTDVRMRDDPADDEVQVIHLHGMPSEPASLVLPGRTTNALVSDSAFTTFLRATMAPCNVLYLGFSFGLAELHLRAILAWLSTEVSGAREHYLLLPAGEVRARKDDMAVFEGFGFVNVVVYEPDESHTLVERVAVALAPRAASSGEDSAGSRTQPTWVQPIMARSEACDDHERPQQRVTSFDYGWSGGEAVATPQDVLEAGRAIVIGAPGMGKTTLMDWLPAMVEGRSWARGNLCEFAPAREGAPPEEAIARILRVADGERIPIEVLRDGDGVLLLDGLDEVDDDLRDRAAGAITAAASRWSDHCWVVTSRPTVAAQTLSTEGFAAFHILPSRRWARRYLETRSVPQDRVEHAMLDGYGLGDLLGVPLFAERLADRLLDGVEVDFSPLELLVDEQYAATRREARRAGQEAGDLGGWLRSLAVALELRGRNSADLEELAAVLGPGDLAASEARGRLVEVTLLAEIPGKAAFPLKTLQEGLCANAIVTASDPVAVLGYAASALVGGVERLRDDIDFTIDLVFEHADRDVRRALRAIDPPRWARTVMTRGDLDDAREAFQTLWDWHEERDMGFIGFGESGLRSTRQTIRAIARRWPTVILERRDELEGDANSDAPSARDRALTALGELPPDGHTDGWLLPRLQDSDPQIAIHAAQLAGRLRASSAEPVLRSLLDDDEERLAKVALSALVEIVDVQSLAELGARASTRNGLQPVAERLLKRLDLDTGIELVARSSQVDGVLPWLTQRLIETAHADAWIPARVAALMAACAQMGGGSMPEPDLLAGIFARQPAAAIAAVRVQRILDGPWGSGGQLLPLSLLDPALLAGDEHADLREAIDRAVDEETDRQGRVTSHERKLAGLQALLDDRGLEIEPAELDPPYGSLHTLEPRDRELLGELVNRWWPETGLTAATGEDELSEPTRILLLVGAQTKPALSPARWLELLDAHLAARQFGEYELADHGVSAWLTATYDDDYEQHLTSRIATAKDATALSKLIAIPAREARTPRVTELAFARLGELSSDTPRWLNVVGMLIEDGHIDEARVLLDTDIQQAAREGILARLAIHGDPEAQVNIIDGLTRALESGQSPERPHWQSNVETPEVVAAASRLADAALSRNVREIPGFAISLIQACRDEESLTVLEELAAKHHVAHSWLWLSVEQMTRRIATRQVLLRLPEALNEVASEFEQQARSRYYSPDADVTEPQR